MTNIHPAGRRRIASSLPAAAWAVAVLLALAAHAHAEAPPNPPRNLEMGPLPSYCYRQVPPTPCADGEIYYLDQVRAAMGLGPYALPANFLSMTPAQQMFILSNLDRIAYSRAPIEGLNSALDAAAIAGAYADVDPEPSEVTFGQPLYGYASNWAGAFPSTLDAYFFWMYADGYESGNIDCRSPTDAGCWGHRQDILWEEEFATEPGLYLYAMGAGATTDQHAEPSYAMTVVDSQTVTPPPYYYTWAQAVAEGAGTNPYPVAPPVEEKVQLSIAFRGKGSVAGGGFNCNHSCAKQVTKYEPLTLVAHPVTGYRFAGWQGCATQHGTSCTLEPLADTTLQVSFTAKGKAHAEGGCKGARSRARRLARRHRRLVRRLRHARGSRRERLLRQVRQDGARLRKAKVRKAAACR